MQTLRETIADFKTKGQAIGHFNFSDSNQLKAIIDASKESSLPVIAGLSEGEREYFPLMQAKALIELYQNQGVQIYFNADHTYSIEKVQRAIAAGVDSVVVDGAKLPLEENIHLLNTSVKYARASGRDVVMEGELGYIGTSSSLHDELPEGVTDANMTTVEDAKKFVTETGIDCFAPAVGNVHGMLKNAAEPRLHPDRVKAISDAVGIPLVLHGASGNTEDDIQACIKAGITIVHINTELRVLYHNSLRDSLKGDETTPYKFLTPSVDAMKQFLIGKMKVFAGQSLPFRPKSVTVARHMELTVEKRDVKNSPHSLRRKGLLPAVVYGRSEESTPITVNAKDFGKIFKAAGESTVISLTGLGASKDALIHEVDFDVLTGAPIHADFYAIEKGQKVTVAVPLEFDGVSPAVKEKGGILTKVLHELEIECEPKDLPQHILVDISKLVELTDQIHVSDLKLPPSAKISAAPEEVVAMISVAKEEPVEEVAAPTDLSAIEISEERGKKEDADGAPAAEGAAPAAPKADAPKAKKE